MDGMNSSVGLRRPETGSAMSRYVRLAPDRGFEARTLRLTDRCRPFRNGGLYSPGAAECRSRRSTGKTRVIAWAAGWRLGPPSLQPQVIASCLQRWPNVFPD